MAASYQAHYDGLKRLVGYNDSDLGSCADTPLPASCTNSTDLAWKYTYDGDGNQLSQTDPRNQTVYTTYDALDRPLCRALSTADASACSGSTERWEHNGERVVLLRRAQSPGVGWQ